MVRDSKKVVAVEGEEDDIGQDRISQLPDEIIHTILRSLESHDAAARTSVLSRKWLQLWRRYPFFEYGRCKSNQTRFSSFVASCSRKLPPRPDSDHSSYPTVASIRDFSIFLRHNFQVEELDRLMSLIRNANGLSPNKFCLRILRGSLRCAQGYNLKLVPDWSRTKSISLYGCDLAFTIPFDTRDNHYSGVVSLGRLEYLNLLNVKLGEELLCGFLANAPRLVSLRMVEVFGIDRLEVVSSPRLRHLSLYSIYGVRKRDQYRFEKMRGLRISCPKLEWLSILLEGLEELVIDAPNVTSLNWTVNSNQVNVKVKIVSLASNCKSRVDWLLYEAGLTPQRLRLSLCTMFSQLHHLTLFFPSYFSSSDQEVLHPSRAEYDRFPPLRIDEVQFGLLISDVRLAGTLLDSLFWACLPKFMSITKGEDDCLVVAEYMCRVYLKLDSTDDSVNATSFWSHRLKEMKIENDIGEMMKISKDVIPSLPDRKKIRFMLIWN